MNKSRTYEPVQESSQPRNRAFSIHPYIVRLTTIPAATSRQYRYGEESFAFAFFAIATIFGLALSGFSVKAGVIADGPDFRRVWNIAADDISVYRFGSGTECPQKDHIAHNTREIQNLDPRIDDDSAVAAAPSAVPS